jgi:hypothetical protein
MCSFCIIYQYSSVLHFILCKTLVQHTIETLIIFIIISIGSCINTGDCLNYLPLKKCMCFLSFKILPKNIIILSTALIKIFFLTAESSEPCLQPRCTSGKPCCTPSTTTPVRPSFSSASSAHSHSLLQWAPMILPTHGALL